MVPQPFCGPLLFHFLNLYTVGRTPAHRTTETEKKCTQISMSQVGFEPIITVFERAKTVHALGGPYTYASGSRVRLGEEPGSD
jgi:hypothetical protein